MNSNELYQKLVDLYAGDELPTELKDELESAALAEPQLAWEMQTLRSTVANLRSIPLSTDLEASMFAVRQKLADEGVVFEDDEVQVHYIQHYLPISG